MILRKVVAILITGMLVVSSVALAETEHEHTFDAWTYNGDSTHTAVCSVCGESVTAKCTTFSYPGAPSRAGVCGFCGNYAEGTFEPIEGAEAVTLSENPASQRGVFVAVGKASPFSADPAVLYAFVIGYCNAGNTTAFKNKSVVTLPIHQKFPEGFKVTRISVSSGDDSTVGKTETYDIDYEYKDGTLIFESKSNSIFVISVEQ